MAETLQDHGTGLKWHWFNIEKDLAFQGLIGVSIDPLSMQPYGCRGQFEDVRFVITWIKDVLMLLTMTTFTQEIVDAFTKVLEYEPFCMYDRDGMVTVEWDKVNPTSRFEDLQQTPEVSNLVQLNPKS